MTKLGKLLFTFAAAGLLSASVGSFVTASADETVVAPETTIEAPAVTDPATTELTDEATAVAPEGTGDTTTEVAPSSGTGTAEEPSYSVVPSEGPGGGCRGNKIQEPSV